VLYAVYQLVVSLPHNTFVHFKGMLFNKSWCFVVERMYIDYQNIRSNDTRV